MPNVKAPQCEYSPAGSPAGCSMDLSGDLSVLSSPLSAFPHHAVSPFPAQDTSLGRCRSGYDNNNGRLGNQGLYCSTSSMYPLKQPDSRTSNGTMCYPQPCVTETRLYHSLENLHWATVSDAGAYPYRSVDSEFILHCTSSSHWYDGHPQGPQIYSILPSPESVALYSRGVVRKDIPLFPQWLLPAVEDWSVTSNARRGLRDKLRLQSTRVREPQKPLRPVPMYPCDQDVAAQAVPLSSLGQRGREQKLSARRITSPEEIKQEAMRRLHLRRQRSTPNLALSSRQESSSIPKSLTSDPICPVSAQSTPERKRPPVGRLHIPTFEEFKRMRQKESGRNHNPSSTQWSGDVESNDKRKEVNGEEEEQIGKTQYEERSDKINDLNHSGEHSGEMSEPSSTLEVPGGPICTGPVARSPLHSQAPIGKEEETKGMKGLRATDVAVVPFPIRRESGDGPASCCPAILLDSTDISSYGAKIYKMKDGFLGSALDLIKKSCSADIASETLVQLSREQNDAADIIAPHPNHQSTPVAMTTSACGEEPTGRGGKAATECGSGAGCRRSSSDAAYELAESVRAQRECRLRPHYSDPMPADATKRKQLEMKIAAAARLHIHRRERDSVPSTVRGRSEPRVEERSRSLGVTRTAHHRWSTVSSLSADSGVIGLSDEREEEEDPRRARHSAGAEVERMDSGIGSGLARGWRRPLPSLRNWEVLQPCPDCGHKEGARGEGMCERCSKLRTERKEAIMEFLNTESSYGEDLRIIKEEFFCPMQSAGLLTTEQLTVVFSNVQELIDVNERFTEHLQDSIEQAFDQGDEDLQTVCIGEIFLEFVNMLPAFQTYCLQQSTSVNMLNTLEKEKELLRIFLDVSQNDNTALRRMNLRSFLMAPLQRVTKYPLLLSRISKATHECHPDNSRLKEAKSRVESHLEHINMKTKQEGTATWSLRSFRRDSRKNREVIDIEMRELSMKTVGWARESTRFIMEGSLQLAQPADGQWLKKGSKSLKFQNVHSLLMVRTLRATESVTSADGGLRGELESLDTVQDGVLVLIKDKSSGKFTILREPIRLANCVVSVDPDCDDTFEVLDIRREAFVFRASDKPRTQQWFRQINRYSCDLGSWRKRRNALPNIMINTGQCRS